MATNELVAKLGELQGQIDSLENEAKSHEQAAREAYAKRAELKKELSELRSTINDARLVHAAESSAKTASEAADRTISISEQANAVLKRLSNAAEMFESKLAELDKPQEENAE